MPVAQRWAPPARRISFVSGRFQARREPAGRL